MTQTVSSVTPGRSEYLWAIAAIGAALVALFIAAAATGAAGKTIPTELLAVGGALSGALVGVLVPPPAANRAAIAGASVIHSAAVTAAANQASEIEADPASSDEDKSTARMELADVVATSKQSSSQVRGKAAVGEAVGRYCAVVDPGPVAQKAAQAADGARDDAVLAASAARSASVVLDGGKIIVPLMIFVIALFFGISMSNGHIRYAGCPVGVLKSGQAEAPCATALFQTANAMITLASATAGALVGLFAPSPAQST